MHVVVGVVDGIGSAVGGDAVGVDVDASVDMAAVADHGGQTLGIPVHDFEGDARRWCCILGTPLKTTKERVVLIDGGAAAEVPVAAFRRVAVVHHDARGATHQEQKIVVGVALSSADDLDRGTIVRGTGRCRKCTADNIVNVLGSG